MRCGFERSAHRVLVVSIEKRKRPVSGKMWGKSNTEKKKKKKKRRDTFFVISFIVVITLILLDSLCLSRLSLSLSIDYVLFFKPPRAKLQSSP